MNEVHKRTSRYNGKNGSLIYSEKTQRYSNNKRYLFLNVKIELNKIQTLMCHRLLSFGYVWFPSAR